jgi:hypothetical protein
MPKNTTEMFSSQDLETMNVLKSVTEERVRWRQETTNQLARVADITGNIANIASSAASIDFASIASSAAAIRKSDNDVLIMSQKIAADKEKWHDMLTHIFSGRDKAIDAFIEQIANGAQSNNNELILKAMDGLSNIVASSPWPDFNSFNKLIDSGGVIDLF